MNIEKAVEQLIVLLSVLHPRISQKMEHEMVQGCSERVLWSAREVQKNMARTVKEPSL